jgi:hypothetical protein
MLAFRSYSGRFAGAPASGCLGPQAKMALPPKMQPFSSKLDPLPAEAGAARCAALPRPPSCFGSGHNPEPWKPVERVLARF